MSNEVSAVMKGEVVKKFADLLNGERTEAEQLELIYTGLIVLIDMLRAIRGNPATLRFLQEHVRAIGRGKRPRFGLIAADQKEVA